MKEKHFLSLDIGSSKVCALIGELKENDTIAIIGYGEIDSDGVQKGVIVSIEKAVKCIKKALEEAEIMAGTSLEKAYVGISGSHIRGFNSRAMITISSKGRAIVREDINRVLEAAKKITIPQDKHLLHVIPQEFIVDDQKNIADPLGMICTKLEVYVHLVTCSSIVLRNLIECVNRAGIPKVVPVLEQLAASAAVLKEEEKNLGVALIDIGGGTSSLAVFDNGSLWHTFVLPIGGILFTSDLAVGLRTPIAEAEKIKKKYGSVSPSYLGEDDTIEVPSIAGSAKRFISRQIINEIVKPRAEELFIKIKDELKRVDLYQYLTAGIVLTGGGSLLDGITDFAQAIFDLNVSVGKPYGVEGPPPAVDNPAFSTAVGLIKYAAEEIKNKEKLASEQSFFNKLKSKIKLLFE